MSSLRIETVTSMRREVAGRAQRQGYAFSTVFKEQGPEHKRMYLCDYKLTHKKLGVLTIEGVEWKTSKGEAKEATAALVLEHI